MYTTYTDDSIAHLLIMNNSVSMANSTFTNHHHHLGINEYEDLTEVIEITDNDKTQNIYTDDPIELNHYSYIPENQIASIVTNAEAIPMNMGESTQTCPTNSSEYYVIPSNQPLAN
jgi:hypothetical protein